MALKFTQKTERVEFSDDDYIEVRGLGVSDLTLLYETHRDSMEAVFSKFTGGAESVSNEDLISVLNGLITSFPGLAAHCLALAADAPEEFDTITKLPIDVQVAALEKVGALTFAMQGGLKNFVETVTRIAGNTSGLSEKLRGPARIKKPTKPKR